jgi:outer membrane protein OmpA-like peptidoglycan-associated protein
MLSASLRLLLLAVSLSWSLAHALLPAKKDIEVLLAFEARSVTLAVSERMKLERAIEQVRRENWCLLELAVVLGYSQRGETSIGDERELSQLRANEVASLLQQFGISKHVIFTEGQGIKASSHREGERNDARVVVEFQGTPWHDKCRGEVRAKDGLRR